MSFLTEILAKRQGLRSTETFVTHADGRKFKEADNQIVEVERPQYGFVVDTKPDDVPSKITDHIYLGSQDCCDERVLTDHGITHVLSIGIEAPTKCPDVTYKFVECLDLPESDIKSSLGECIPFLTGAKAANCKVLVHCNAGVSRSASVVIGYLILVEGFSYLDAYNVVKHARNCIKPNAGFEKQLRCLCRAN